MYINIGVLKETHPHELRVALVPEVAEKLIKLGAKLHLEAGAAAGTKENESSYKDVAICVDRKKMVAEADIVLAVQAPALEVISAMKEGSILISFIYAGKRPEIVQRLIDKKITCFAMERIPRITRAQAMDGLSSQSALSGYYAVTLGAMNLNRILPKITTAAGAIGPAKVLVMGLGVAGLEAIATAHRLGAIVEGYDVRPETKEQAMSLGAKFLDTGIDARDKGGYARELTDAEKTKVDGVLTEHIQNADLIITTAGVPGKPAPKLISHKQLIGMKPGSVIIDLSAEGGGNCEDTIPGETTLIENVKIVAPINIPSSLSRDASELYSKNIYHLLELMMKDNVIKVDWNDEIIAKTVLTHEGKNKTESPTAKDKPSTVAPAAHHARGV
jgi:NAD(P) transhydrogenase subunit alpha